MPVEVTDSDPLDGLKRVGGFEIVERLGEGGMGTVFKARQRSLDRLVALKVLTRKLAENAEYVARFDLEARFGARLNHPNVVQVIEQGTDGDVKFIAFEFLDGPSLEAVFRERGRVPEEEALEIAREIAEALAYVHQHGIVHRDLKPENVLFTKTGIAKLADLGLAKIQDEDSSLTKTGIVMGTPYYMAPEQALGERDLDGRADLFSLGIVLYRAVTGRLPFQGDTPLVILTKNINEDVPDARDAHPLVSDKVAQLIRGLTTRERKDRYPDAISVITEIDSILQKGRVYGPKPYIEAAEAPKTEVALTSPGRSASRRRKISQIIEVPATGASKRGRRSTRLAVLIGFFLGIGGWAAASQFFEGHLPRFTAPWSPPPPPDPPIARPVTKTTVDPIRKPAPVTTGQTAPVVTRAPAPPPPPIVKDPPKPKPLELPKPVPVAKLPENARVWDGHRWRRTEAGHAHGPRCGHWKRDGRWNVFPYDARLYEYRLTEDQRASPQSGIYDADGKTWVLKGHTHTGSCFHKFSEGRWVLEAAEN